MTDDHGQELDADMGRYCERCELTRIADCSILCFATRDEKPSKTVTPTATSETR